MIELYRAANDALGAEIEGGLKELVLAHRVVVVPPAHPPEHLPAGTSLPALRDGDRLITGGEALRAHLRHLEHVVFEWRKYESDSCYIEADGSHC